MDDSKSILKYTSGHGVRDTSNCSGWHIFSLLNLCSKVNSQYTSKYTSITLPDTPLSMFWCILMCMLTRLLPIALNGTHSVRLIILSQISFHDSSKYTTEYIFIFSPGLLAIMLPIALNGILPACWTVFSQVGCQDALRYTSKRTLKHIPIRNILLTPCIPAYRILY
jgi:hypothetical protein